MVDLKLLLQEKIGSYFSSKYNINLDSINVEHPDNMEFGDYATSVPLVVASKLKKAPMEIAAELCEVLKTELPQDIFQKIEDVRPGFVNFTLSYNFLLKELDEIRDNPKKYGWGDLYGGEKVIIEYTDPNPFKVFHIGHLMPNVIGESLSRLIESQGAEVKRANYQGDVGMHVAKSLWGMRKMMLEQNITLSQLEDKSLSERIDFLGNAYALGAAAFKDKPEVKDEVEKLNKKIYDLNPEIKDLYEKGRAWSLEYFESLYARLGTKFDYYFFERESGQKGLKVANELLDKGILEKSDGALVFKGDKYGLHTRVFVNSYGLPTYEAKDLGLSKTKYENFKYDMSIIVTSNEIDEYFKVVLKAMEFIYPDLASKTVHISHGNLRLKTGKMSSRTGDIVAGDTLMDRVKEVVLNKMEYKNEEIADEIAIAAIKYGILKNHIGGDIVYDEDSWLSITGDTGPYLQYTYARANSVIENSNKISNSDNAMIEELNEDEKQLLRTLYLFPEMVRKSAEEYSPNTLAYYLNNLARKYNTFYSNHRILEAENSNARNIRIIMTLYTKIIIKNGLWMLGIKAPEKM